MLTIQLEYMKDKVNDNNLEMHLIYSLIQFNNVNWKLIVINQQIQLILFTFTNLCR